MKLLTESFVTVLIPVYNGESFLIDAINSVLVQSYKNLEILVLDDASTDRTPILVESSKREDNRIKYYRNSYNMGVASTRNKGFNLARGKYIALLDADDCWKPDKLMQQIKEMEQKGLDVCYTAYGFIDKNGAQDNHIYCVPEKLTLHRLIVENVIGCSTTLFRKEITNNFLMRKDYMHEDYVFWLELMRSGLKFGGINRPLVMYRKTETGRSADKRKAALNRWKVLRSFLNMSLLYSFLAFGTYAIKGLYKHFIAKLFANL